MTAVKLDEPILPDDYPVYGDYLYVVDGKVVRSEWHDITVALFKRALSAKEVRRCDINGRRKALTKREG
jgi:hypothetical protein